MKKIALILAMTAIGLACHAQMPAPQQVDTLVVKSVRYNFSDVRQENWPCEVILKSADEITIGDNTYDIKSVEEGTLSARYAAREIIFTLANEDKLSFYQNGVHRVIVYSGYEFFCEPAAEKNIKTKARRALHAADSLASAAEEKIKQSIKSRKGQ